MKKQFKPRLDCYDQPIFSMRHLYVNIGHDIKYLRKYFTEMDGNDLSDNQEPDWLAYCHTAAKRKSDGEVCILIDLLDKTITQFKTDPVEAVNTMAHEAWHAVYAITENNGIPTHEATNEVYANLVGWVTGCVYKSVKAYTNGRF